MRRRRGLKFVPCCTESVRPKQPPTCGMIVTRRHRKYMPPIQPWKICQKPRELSSPVGVKRSAVVVNAATLAKKESAAESSPVRKKGSAPKSEFKSHAAKRKTAPSVTPIV